LPPLRHLHNYLKFRKPLDPSLLKKHAEHAETPGLLPIKAQIEVQ